MDSFNARGCDEIMCHFIKDLNMSYDISVYDVEVVETEPLNESSVNIETD
jgi:hypothetical protein